MFDLTPAEQDVATEMQRAIQVQLVGTRRSLPQMPPDDTPGEDLVLVPPPHHLIDARVRRALSFTERICTTARCYRRTRTGLAPASP